jgi:DNA-binding transcriptional LysR family regulator
MKRRFNHLPDVEAFVTVIEQGSMTAGAVALSTTPSVLSRAISRLETRLGCQLMRRTTRRLSLTDAGKLYLAQARAAFSLFEDVERQIQGWEQQLVGQVRLSAPTTYGHHRLPRLLSLFAREYPQIEIELNITNRNVDLIAEGFDLAIRLGDLPDSGLVARKLEDAELCLVASAEYLEREGSPTDLESLGGHTCIPFLMPSTGRVVPWLLRDGQQDIDWMPPTGIEVTDDVLAVVSLAEQGMGICQTFDFIARDRIQRGLLEEVLPSLRGRSRPFSLIYAPHRRLSAASRALIEVLVKHAVDDSLEGR